MGGLRSPLVNKFSEHAGERAQMEAERRTRNRDYLSVISDCLLLVFAADRMVVWHRQILKLSDQSGFVAVGSGLPVISMRSVF